MGSRSEGEVLIFNIADVAVNPPRLGFIGDLSVCATDMNGSGHQVATVADALPSCRMASGILLVQGKTRTDSPAQVR
jgi:hypothetical protein